ncbi:MAG: DEAD/DEAH box helicase family protein [Ruminococcus sp.]|nr:DEAD/DEAH box helicase family protein [Ruminococcus sp.]
MAPLVIPDGMNYHAAQTSAKELTAANLTPLIAGMSLATGYTLGAHDQYLNAILTTEDADKLDWGSSIAVFSPTGAGKSWTVERIALDLAKHKQVIFLTNRSACETQLKQELLRKSGAADIPADLIGRISVMENLTVMTYQKFVKHCHRYHGKALVLILDECHCLAEDATFSVYPQQMLRYLHSNLDNTVRIYLTATPEAVLPTLWELESVSGKALYPLTADNLTDYLRFTPVQDDTRIQHTYLMEPNWDYLTFKNYDPDNRTVFLDYLNAVAANGKKALIYINDIQKGRELQELLGDSQHIYSDEDKKSELHQITEHSRFETAALVTTKVAENGLSLHDDSLSVIVAETFDPITLQQVIGRARVSRKRPREVIVLLPDYTASHLGSIAGQLYMQLQEFDRAAINPDFAMQYLPQPNPYVYYDAITQKPVLNRIGRDELRRQLDLIGQLRAEETEHPHTFLRHILQLYGKDTAHIEALSITYDKTSDCHARICSAWEDFKASKRGADELSILKTALKAACNETGAYPKELKSNIQIETVNEILRFAGISETLSHGHTMYDIRKPETP